MRILDKNRLSYKKTSSDGGCIFCDNKDTIECLCLCGIHWRVLVNRYPYMDGNVMIVPIRHIERIDDIKEAEWQEFGAILTKTQKILGRIFETDSFNVALNVGPESGASIQHIHWQVVPRRFKNMAALDVFADLYVVEVTPEETKRLIDEAMV